MITGPDEGAAAGHGRLRASHADREQVIDTLKIAFADGRLDEDELDARVGQALAARTYAELATATVGIPAAPAQAPPPRLPIRPPVNKEAVKRGLVAAGAMIPPAMFVAAAYGPSGLTPLALLALPLLFIELPVVIIFVAITLARQRNGRSRASRGHLPPRSGQAGRAVEAERHGSTGPDPAPPGRASARPARIRGSTGPGGTGHAVAGRVSRCRPVPGPRRARPEPLPPRPERLSADPRSGRADPGRRVSPRPDTPRRAHTPVGPELGSVLQAAGQLLAPRPASKPPKKEAVRDLSFRTSR